MRIVERYVEATEDTGIESRNERKVDWLKARCKRLEKPYLHFNSFMNALCTEHKERDTYQHNVVVKESKLLLKISSSMNTPLRFLKLIDAMRCRWADCHDQFFQDIALNFTAVALMRKGASKKMLWTIRQKTWYFLTHDSVLKYLKTSER